MFVRLASDSEVLKADARGIREVLARKVPETKDCLGFAARVDTGWALCPLPGKAANLKALAEQMATALGAKGVGPREQWTRFVLPAVPQVVYGVDDQLKRTTRRLDQAELKAELTSRFGAAPTMVRWSDHGNDQDRYRTLLVAFSQSELPLIPSRITLMDERIRLKLRPANPKVPQCSNCWAFHRSERCTRLPRCAVCTSINHTTANHAGHPQSGCKASTDQCQCPPVCMNCHGPHSAHDPNCPARPSLQNGRLVSKTRSEVRAIRLKQDAARGRLNTCPGVRQEPAGTPPNRQL
jgi:hypothetical protein